MQNVYCISANLYYPIPIRLAACRNKNFGFSNYAKKYGNTPVLSNNKKKFISIFKPLRNASPVAHSFRAISFYRYIYSFFFLWVAVVLRKAFSNQEYTFPYEQT